ncbi:MAG TPA: RDD family protein [Candidatus Acidoferrales bacterium]|nr:RDD family protein [Candidatus Acidoferrales bacterium]
MSPPASVKLSNCPKCGVEVASDAEICNACGERLTGTSPDPDATPLRNEAAGARRGVRYAGFWLRLAAYFIDSLLLGIVVGFVILRPLMDRAGIPADNPWILFTGGSRQIIAINLLVSMASWLYWASMESSPWQATLGKRAFGLKVTDLAGRRISFARASGRYFGKIIFVGFILAGVTEKKQALHDMIAGCLVVRKA